MNNQVLITLDSLRQDVFDRADIPFLRSLGEWKKATTPATYTLPAHASFFVGKLPQTFDESDFYDTVAGRFDEERGLYRNALQLWRLDNAEAKRDAAHTLPGRNIIEGFSQLGYRTIGSGAVNWFKKELPAAHTLTDPFDEFEFLGHTAAVAQVAWAIERIRAARNEGKPYFLFINFGETHHPFRFKGCGWGKEGSPYGDAGKCLHRQQACLEFLDMVLRALFSELRDYDLVICSDHGEALGEDGLWGHGFVHPTVMDVPLLISVDNRGERHPLRNLARRFFRDK